MTHDGEPKQTAVKLQNDHTRSFFVAARCLCRRVMARRTVQTRFSALLLLLMACFFWKAASFSLLKHSAKGVVSNFDAASFHPGMQIILRFAAG